MIKNRRSKNTSILQKKNRSITRKKGFKESNKKYK